ncbi:MAG: phospholipase [Deltaproteobacteria bacterium]|nr:phospholipase [Deltaproteobacteria bacterium]
MSVLAALTPEARRALSLALAGERIGAPFTALAVARYVGGGCADGVARELERLAALGMTHRHLVELLAVADAAPRMRSADERVSLVWSGPEGVGARTRDTSVVVRELFAQARAHVLVVGFAVHQGRTIFAALAERLDAEPALTARLCLHVERKRGDTTIAAQILKEFADRFHGEQWPGKRLPEVYYDPRTLEPDEPGRKRAALHAKCIVVDGERAFVTSANFTEAAQERNIEVGALIGETSFARTLSEQIQSLIESRVLVRVPGI